MTSPPVPGPPAPGQPPAPGEAPARAEAAASAHRPWTLQRRLILTIVAIVSLILVLVAATTSAILGSVLEDRLSEQVHSNLDRMKVWVAQEVRVDPTAQADDVLERMQASPGFLLGIQATSISAAVVTEDGVQALTSAQLDELIAGVAAEPGEPVATRTVSISGLGSFQVAGAVAGNAITVVGLSRDEIASTIAQMLTVIALLTTGGLVLLAVATAWTIRAGLAPLRAVADTATRVAQQPLDQGAVTIAERVPDAQADPRTEVGRVGAALNTLLDHVSRSLDARQRNEERMRRFVADASHELRTPLASIRGYSELSLRALTQTPPGVAAEKAAELAAATTQQSLDRIQAQSVRMTGIVEDLLLLARLDEGQELVYGTVDVARLMVDAVGDAQVAGPDHEWIIDVPEESITIAGDAARLHQVVANLLANARVHTPAGTVVTGSVGAADGSVILRVHDTGPGVPAAVQDELFERFARADVSRARHTGGSGLGLSIARAIVEAHGGEVTVTSRPGDTTFSVRLPLPAPGDRR